ncbi:hypothetical protein C8J57DRAFT_1273109 [Mycena rebaudengoi]|nr:hypothetical protein C8J57DRAFT_1273109 [Mycena rebaudengoi]
MSTPQFFSVPITMDGAHQRTVKIRCPGISAVFTTIRAGTLIFRKKTDRDLPVPSKSAPAIPAEPARFVVAASQDVRDIDEVLENNNILVRDFAYAESKRGHACPVLGRPHEILQLDEDSDLENEEEVTNHLVSDDPDSEKVPQPFPLVNLSRPLTKEDADQRVRPYIDLADLPHVEPVKVPSPSTPFEPAFPAHRIPGLFNHILAKQEHDYRLGPDRNNKIPIPGMYTRRLLTIDPDSVDLARYRRIDFEALYAYDRALARQLRRGDALYPWRPVVKGRDYVPENTPVEFYAWDEENKTAEKHLERVRVMADDTMQAEEENRVRAQNVEAGRVYQGFDNGASDWDVDGPGDWLSTVGRNGLTPQQQMDILNKRKATATPEVLAVLERYRRECRMNFCEYQYESWREEEDEKERWPVYGPQRKAGGVNGEEDADGDLVGRLPAPRLILERIPGLFATIPTPPPSPTYDWRGRVVEPKYDFPGQPPPKPKVRARRLRTPAPFPLSPRRLVVPSPDGEMPVQESDEPAASEPRDDSIGFDLSLIHPQHSRLTFAELFERDLNKSGIATRAEDGSELTFGQLCGLDLPPRATRKRARSTDDSGDSSSSSSSDESSSKRARR